MTCDSSVAGNWRPFPFTPNCWAYFSSEPPTNTDPYFTQPVQHVFPNCTFVSALIAVTWVNKDYIINKMGIRAFTDNGYAFWDDGTDGTVGWKTVKINNTLLVDPAGSYNRCGAISTNCYELWPSFIEKAYAKFCQYKKDHDKYDKFWLMDPTKNPGLMSTLTRTEWGGNPTTALFWLTGCTKLNVKVADVSPMGYIKTNLCVTTSGNFRRTKYPAAAWTYGSGEQFNGACGIFANHCYALLGIDDSERYIILRDTFSIDPVSCNQIPSASLWNYMDVEFNLGRTYPVPTNPHVSNSWQRWDFTRINDGVFGISVADFQKYFEWFGFVR